MEIRWSTVALITEPVWCSGNTPASQFGRPGFNSKGSDVVIISTCLYLCCRLFTDTWRTCLPTLDFIRIYFNSWMKNWEVCYLGKGMEFRCLIKMKLQEHVEFRKHDLKLLGKVDYGDFTSEDHSMLNADHALVFLFKPFLSGWMQTIRTF